MKQKNCSFAQDFSTLERTQKNRSNTHTPRPRKVMGHNSERTRLLPIIVSVSLLLLATSPLTLLFCGDMMTLSAEGSPVATVTGSEDSDNFGWNVSSAGDVNGDGFSDVIVGAPGHNSDTGVACIFFGNGTMPILLNAQEADVLIIGEI